MLLPSSQLVLAARGPEPEVCSLWLVKDLIAPR